MRIPRGKEVKKTKTQRNNIPIHAGNKGVNPCLIGPPSDTSYFSETVPLDFRHGTAPTPFWFKLGATNFKSLASAGKELKENFLRALAEREEANRTGKISSIIFIRDRNSRRQEVSAYIDYAHRLTTDDFEVYFSGKKRLFPRNTDLSFYNWDRNVSTSNSSPNYQVIAENACGLLFRNQSDRKIINVDPKAYPGDNTTRTPVETDLYLHAVIYDHIVRGGT
ncbi:cilia- and flagella-associated protein 299 [Rhynochetos jubatus]